MKECKKMKVQSLKDKTEEGIELTNTKNENKQESMRKFIIMKINEPLISGTNVKS